MSRKCLVKLVVATEVRSTGVLNPPGHVLFFAFRVSTLSCIGKVSSSRVRFYKSETCPFVNRRLNPCPLFRDD